MQLIFIIITGIFLLFIPGFFISFIFFDINKIDFLERIGFSIAFSIGIVPLVVFYGNILGIRITPVSVIVQVLAILSFTGAIIAIQEFIRWRRSR